MARRRKGKKGKKRSKRKKPWKPVQNETKPKNVFSRVSADTLVEILSFVDARNIARLRKTSQAFNDASKHAASRITTYTFQQSVRIERKVITLISQKCPHLRNVSFLDCKEPCVFHFLLPEHFAFMLQSCSNIRSLLYLPAQTLLSATLTHDLPNLRHLHMQYLTQEALDSIAHKCKNLEKLELDNDTMMRASLRLVFRTCVKLRQLVVFSVLMPHDDYRELRHLKRLETIRFYGGMLDDTDCLALARSLHKPTLTNLKISGQSVTAQALTELAESLPNLAVLDMMHTGLTLLDVGAVLRMVDNLPGLRRLTIPWQQVRRVRYYLPMTRANVLINTTDPAWW